jgi:hypothetical protein
MGSIIFAGFCGLFLTTKSYLFLFYFSVKYFINLAHEEALDRLPLISTLVDFAPHCVKIAAP